MGNSDHDTHVCERNRERVSESERGFLCVCEREKEKKKESDSERESSAEQASTQSVQRG